MIHKLHCYEIHYFPKLISQLIPGVHKVWKHPKNWLDRVTKLSAVDYCTKKTVLGCI